MGGNRLAEYQSSTVVYIGESGGCIGTTHFHRLLDKRFEEINEIQIPQWRGIHDYLRI